MSSSGLPSAEILVVGAGIIGLSIALELRLCGASVAVVERNAAVSQASVAAAGMLAARDPTNPPQLQQLSSLSLRLYDGFLRTIEAQSQLAVPYQTETTIQYKANGLQERLEEHSLDPRQLGPALLAAVKNTGVEVFDHTDFVEFPPDTQIIHTTGAWARRFHVHPRKGQMLRVQLPSAGALTEVHRGEHVYVLPRSRGPQAGTALIGATIEDAGFDVATYTEDLLRLRQTAAALSSQLVFLREAPLLEAWAGLRPATPDELPIISRINDRELVATGHFRNGILLAPATAKVVSDLAQGRTPPVDLHAFRSQRFAV